jgi:hypothetical protein
MVTHLASSSTMAVVDSSETSVNFWTPRRSVPEGKFSRTLRRNIKDGFDQHAEELVFQGHYPALNLSPQVDTRC